MQPTRPSLQQVSREIHFTIRKLIGEGADRNEVSLVLLAYALHLEFEERGAPHVVDHLRRIARRFELGDGLTFAEIAYSDRLQRQSRKSAA